MVSNPQNFRAGSGVTAMHWDFDWDNVIVFNKPNRSQLGQSKVKAVIEVGKGFRDEIQTKTQ